MRKREQEWRAFRPASAVTRHGWEWVMAGARVFGVRSPRGTVFECRNVGGGYVGRKQRDFELKDA